MPQTLSTVKDVIDLQHRVDASSGVLKNVCMFCLVFKHGCSKGNGLGQFGRCNRQHFIDKKHERDASEEICKECRFQGFRFHSDFLVRGAPSGHQGDGARRGNT